MHPTEASHSETRLSVATSHLFPEQDCLRWNVFTHGRHDVKDGKRLRIQSTSSRYILFPDRHFLYNKAVVSFVILFEQTSPIRKPIKMLSHAFTPS